MSIASEITRINNNISAAYTACNNKGATMPITQDSANLATCISSISGGGGSSTGINREVVNGVYKPPSTSFSFSLPSTATDIDSYSVYYAFYYSSGILSADLSSLTVINGDNAFDHAFYFCRNFSTVDLSNLTTIIGHQAFSYAFANSGLTNVSFPSLEIIGKSSLNSWEYSYGHFSASFRGTNITTLTFPELTAIYNTGATAASTAVFYNNDTIQKMYFPKLSTITYGSGASTTNQNAHKNLFNGCSALTEIHFGAANQSAIEATDGYSTLWGRGAGNATVYFDL